MKEKFPDSRSDFAKVDAQPGTPDAELPEVTDAELDRSVYSVGDIVLPTPRRRGRPTGSLTKHQVTIRLDQEVLAHFKAGGPGWQTRINRTLREAIVRGE